MCKELNYSRDSNKYPTKTEIDWRRKENEKNVQAEWKVLEKLFSERR